MIVAAETRDLAAAFFKKYSRVVFFFFFLSFFKRKTTRISGTAIARNCSARSLTVMFVGKRGVFSHTRVLRG